MLPRRANKYIQDKKDISNYNECAKIYDNCLTSNENEILSCKSGYNLFAQK